MNPLERAAVSVDVVCFALTGDALSVLLVQRAEPPFAGAWALPGGTVAADETLDAAASRLLAERTGVRDAYLEQLYTFGDPGRDPRGRTLSVAYVALLPTGDRQAVRGGRGVRDLAHARGGLLILAGPVGDGPGSYQLYFWDGQDGVPGSDAPAAAAPSLQLLGDLQPPPGQEAAKAEGVGVVDEEDQHWHILVVFDGLKDGHATRYRVEKP